MEIVFYSQVLEELQPLQPYVILDITYQLLQLEHALLVVLVLLHAHQLLPLLPLALQLITYLVQLAQPVDPTLIHVLQVPPLLVSLEPISFQEQLAQLADLTL
jgi:hypothetical protein